MAVKRLGLTRDQLASFLQEHEQIKQFELLFSTVVDLMTLVTLGLRPSLHAAAQKARDLTVSITALYDRRPAEACRAAVATLPLPSHWAS